MPPASRLVCLILILAAAVSLLLLYSVTEAGVTNNPTPTTMKAVRIHAFGGPEVLTYEDAPLPTPAPGEVLIRVHAAGVNPVDWKTREGRFRLSRGADLPRILGWDCSGVIESVGQGVTRFAKGDAVFAYSDLARDGAYAEFIAVKQDAVARKPDALTHVQAAAVPLAALTAWQALFEKADLQPGQTVLIHAAAGGVGTFAVQFAKAKGARVIGTASERNHEFLRSIGCDEVIDYQKVRFEDAAKDIDVVLDAIGDDTMERSWGVLKKGGIAVSIVGAASPAEAQKHGVRGVSFLVRPDGGQLAEIAQMIEQGKVRPIVSEVLPLADARKAHEMSQTGRTRGKIVLRVRND